MPSVVLPLLFFLMCGIFAYLPTPIVGGRLQPPFIGDNVECQNEGEIVSVTHIPDTNCFQCRCRNKTIECQKASCPSLATCPTVSAQSNDKCCKTCKTCTYLGQIYENDEQWFSGQNSCRTLSCKAGVVTDSRMICVSPCENPITRVGYCCPVCPVWSPLLNTTRQDPCVQCHCDLSLNSLILDNPIGIVTGIDHEKLHSKGLAGFPDSAGWCHCFRTSCPALDCPVHERITPPGKCCAECRTPRPSKIFEEGCVFQNKSYVNGESFRPEPCLFCNCKEGAVLCKGLTCDAPNCSSSRLYYKEDVCCPFCLDQDPLPCKKGGKEYKHDEKWDDDPCTKCVCRNSDIRCTKTNCPFAQGCPKGYKTVRPVKGRCCPSCKEQEATCTVYGDPHYRTFDGHEFNFQGSCKYILAKNCRIRQYGYFGPTKNFDEISFSVIVKNEPRGSAWSTWTRHVAIRLKHGGKHRRIVLLPGKRVKMDGMRLETFPYIDIGLFNVQKDRQGNVQFNAVGGPKVIWDGNSYVEVTIPATYRENMCGLCGNYNGNKSDDYQMSLGGNSLAEDETTIPTRNVNEFAQSWRVGKWKTCKKESDRQYHKKLERRRRRRERERYKFFNGFSDRASRISSVAQSPSIAQLDNFIRAKNNVKKNSGFSKFWRPTPTPSTPKINKKRRHKQKCSQNKDPKQWRPVVAKCKLFHSHIFEACRPYVDVHSYLSNCVMDVCGCPTSGHCYCQSMLAYSKECEKHNVILDWRTATDCQSNYTCPMDGGIFDVCTSPCGPDTCSTYNDVTRRDCLVDKNSCVPGCKCPDGTVLHKNRCIKPKDCFF